MTMELESNFHVLDDAELDRIDGGHGSFGCDVFGGLVGVAIAAISLPAGGPIVSGALGVVGGAAAREACNNH